MRAHHGSIAREQRLEIEEALKEGRLPALVATSSLELGIDMGAIDLVIQIEAPPSVAAGLQRIGRAGPPGRRALDRQDLPEVPRRPGGVGGRRRADERRRHRGDEASRATRSTSWPSRSSRSARWTRERSTTLHALVSGAENFRDLSREQLEGVLDMLSGRYPSDEFAELKPRIIWDREAGTIQSRNDARVVAIMSGGTIPDRGLFGVFLAGDDGKARASRRRAGRGDGLREPGRRGLPARRLVAGASRRSRPIG